MTTRRTFMFLSIPAALGLMGALGGFRKIRSEWTSFRNNTDTNGIYRTNSTEDLFRNSYAVAVEMPEVLATYPCYCGCMGEKFHHKSLLECFQTDHAEGCITCAESALAIKKMRGQGKSSVEIHRYLANVFGYSGAEVPHHRKGAE